MGTMASADLDKTSEDVEVGNPTNGTTRHWHVQSNAVMSLEVRRHEVVWRSDDVFTDKEESDAKAQGRGIGRGFISTLSCGDRVGIVAKARVCFDLIHPTSVPNPLSSICGRIMCGAPGSIFSILSSCMIGYTGVCYVH
jgi:hypothetical protein